MPERRRLIDKAGVTGIALFLLAVLVGSIATSCGTIQPEPASPTSPGLTATLTVPVKMPVTIAIRGSFSDEVLDILGRQISAFEETNPDIRVAVLTAPQRDDRRRIAFSDQLREGDTSTDIYALDPSWLAEFNALGGLAPLDEYITSHALEIEDFFPPAVEASSLDGRTIALPWSIDGGLLYYRRDLLHNYGYEPPFDWPTLEQAAVKIRAGEGLPEGFVWQGAPYESLTCNALEYIWAYGGQVLDVDGQPDFDGAGTRAGLQQMVDLIELGATPPEVASYTEIDARTHFQDGKAAIMRHWASLWPRLDSGEPPLVDLVGISSLPSSCLGGLHLSLSAYSLNPEQAFRFMFFLVSPAQQLELALEAGQLPALDTVYQEPDLLAGNSTLRDLRNALSTARPRPVSPVYAQISESIYTEVNAMLQGIQDVATTAANVQRRLEAAVR